MQLNFMIMTKRKADEKTEFYNCVIPVISADSVTIEFTATEQHFNNNLLS